uniref:Uncharacterized protein n=1 Tax=Vespula pensylvanica TaxID=30213 RepID=A0A834JNY4_VESPE|nr:hypothetical protein H0235_017107 [Vespula pensylvanica]
MGNHGGRRFQWQANSTKRGQWAFPLIKSQSASTEIARGSGKISLATSPSQSQVRERGARGGAREREARGERARGGTQRKEIKLIGTIASKVEPLRLRSRSPPAIHSD